MYDYLFIHRTSFFRETRNVQVAGLFYFIASRSPVLVFQVFCHSCNASRSNNIDRDDGRTNGGGLRLDLTIFRSTDTSMRSSAAAWVGSIHLVILLMSPASIALLYAASTA